MDSPGLCLYLSNPDLKETSLRICMFKFPRRFLGSGKRENIDKQDREGVFREEWVEEGRGP